ncbi:Histone-lysine N-methyltransferase EHMT2 [Dissostichus eleginoides]|uniref:Histone-lysine N-methyltransferase EHMT2 n=1 Tax=Dissostichus eleginoides TaxID=100907 RepID=A0AAD9CKU8_DISEL|nr:Histone-lysine N-methyltransferase EHMT2 [Dissostichus eleginoides]
MAAPVFLAACHRVLLFLFVLFIFVLFVPPSQGITVYDRQTLLNIRASFMDVCALDTNGRNIHRYLLPRLPEGLRAPCCACHRRRRRSRRRGRRAGASVKLRSLAGSRSPSPPSYHLQLYDDGPDQRPHYIHRRSLEPRYTSLRLITPDANLDRLAGGSPGTPARSHVKRGGAVPDNLRPLVWIPWPSDCTAAAPDPVEESEKRNSFKKMLRKEQEEEIEEVPVMSHEEEEELGVSDTEDEEEQGTFPLITACRIGITQVVQRLLRGGGDLTLCDHSQQTALHISSPELQGKVLGWMSRPHLPPQAQLLQAAWQGDLHSLQLLLDSAQTVRVDVNVPNSDGVTAVMLAVRDIDLFEDLATLLTWEHRPVEVVKELLGLSPDLRVRDHSGCSAIHYAVNISSPLKEEIIHMMVEALSHADGASMSPLALDKYSSQDSDSEFGDSDVELDLESLYHNRSVAASPTQSPTHQDGFLLYSHTGEVLESPGYSPLSDHHKGLSQGKNSFKDSKSFSRLKCGLLMCDGGVKVFCFLGLQ